MKQGGCEFVFGLHFHQPVGNFRRVLEEAYHKAYRPLIESFSKRDKLKLCLHISSPLLEYFLDTYPDFIKLIASEVEKGKIEMLGGGFYEPILTSLPLRDIRGQLDLTREFYLKHFNTSFQGIWLTERVWEPHLPSLLKDTGVKYLALDDTHFIQGGYLPEELEGFYVTEDAGNPLGIFPIRKELRYAIPFMPVDKILSVFKEISQESETETLACMLDDGEKFGLWPGTHEWVFDGGWLEEFFDALEENASWLRTSTLSEHFKNNQPSGKVYLPTTEYYEMLEWSMPVSGSLKLKEIKEELKAKKLFDEIDPFLTGGIWRNYFAKYPESNYMHKKVLYLSQKLEDCFGQMKKEDYEQAARLLYQAQCNCPYWHGVFGGIYLNHLREAIYNSLNKLHVLIDKHNHKDSDFIEAELLDMDADFKEEALINSKHIFALVKPGGYLEEISDKKTSVNILDTLIRRQELYHSDILEDEKSEQETSAEDQGIASIHDIKKDTSDELKKKLIYDKQPRKTLSTLILPPSTKHKDYLAGKFDLPLTERAPLEIENLEDSAIVKAGSNIFVAERKISLMKTLEFKKDVRGFDASIEIINQSAWTTHLKFLTEFAFSLLSAENGSRYLLAGNKKLKADEEHTEKNVKLFGVADKNRGFACEIKAETESELWASPVFAVINSLEGYELSYLFHSITAVNQLILKSGEKSLLKFKFRIKDI
ncbi:MAG: DUF1926 domain-containing protein [Elusimicrobia bacterium]|nr:DUF1926 domain-containing protein [Elusimicrobiota bacterium]